MYSLQLTFSGLLLGYRYRICIDYYIDSIDDNCIHIAGCTILDVSIIIVYYCQDVQLFHKANNKSPFSGDDTNDHNDVVTSIISLFMRFNWEILAWATDFCALKGVTAVKNQVVAMFFAPTVITFLGVLCLIWRFVAQRKENTKIFKSEMKSELISQFLWYALFLTLLLTYQGHLIETAALLKCIPFSDSKVLFLNGNISCMQGWQYVVALYLGFWLLPFWLILVFGSHLLRKEYLSLPKLILLFFLPLPFGVYLIISTIFRKIQGTKRFGIHEKPDLVADFLQNGQRKLPLLLRYLCCHGIIVMLRFAMVMMYTYNDDIMNGMLAMLGVVFAKLMYTTVALPYFSLR